MTPYLTHPVRSLDDMAGYIESQLVTIRQQKSKADAALWAAQVHYDRLVDEESKLERELESLHAELALRRYREEGQGWNATL